MFRSCFIFLIILLFSLNGFAQYPHLDSLNAQAYFNKSWDYPLHTRQHQLYLDSALQLLPQNAYYWQQKSMPLYKAQKYQVGRPFLDSAVKYAPERWLDYRGFMKCIFEKNYLEAIVDFRNAINRYGNQKVMDHSYEFYTALSFLQLSNTDSSKYYLDRCIEDDSKHFGFANVHYLHYFYRALIAFEEDSTTLAISYFDKALKTYPQFSDAAYYKALLLLRTNRKEEALLIAQKALQDFNTGYTINEDNVFYEYYPYQIKPYYLKHLVADLAQKE